MDIATRATYRGQLTKLYKNVSEYLQSPESQVKPQNAEKFDTIEEELVVFLERITATRDSLNKANNVVQPSIKAEDMSKECESVADYDDKAISMIARVKQRLSKLRSIQNTAMEGDQQNQQNPLATNHSSVKLPKLNLRKFSGDLKEWLPFWEQFRTSVHENLNLNGAEKFNYLQSLLAGQAAESIAGLTPTQSHYDTAITLLKDEYGDNDKIVDKTMRQLMALSPVHSRYDVIALRRLYNSVITSTRSLTAIGIPTSHYSIMLRSVLLKCMPSELRIEFHRISADVVDNAESSSSTKDIESGSSDTVCSVSIIGDKQFTPILKFLKREVESLEKANEARPPYKQSSPKMMKTATGLILPSEVKTYCCFCKLNSHKSENCTANLSISERKEKLKREGRCFRCTRRGHNSKTCRNKVIRCNTCTGNHATSLCDPSYSRKSSDQRLQKCDQNNAAVVKQTTNLCSSSRQSSDVYLQTACAFLSSGEKAKSTYFVRVVFDGCSQRSYIREEVSKRLNLEIVDTVAISILPFGSTEAPPQRVCNRVRVIVKSQHYNEFVTIVAVETPDICLDTLPVPNLTCADFSNFILADSRENGDPEGGISLLIGADYYWSFVHHNQIKKLSPRLTAIKTILGWTIQGPAADEQHDEGVGQITTTMALQVSLYTDNQIKQFWDLESIGIDNPSAVESDNVDIDKFIKKRGQRYEASLLWRNDKIELSDNRSNALIRLDGLVKKLKRNTGRLQEYDSAMWELINSGFAERVNSNFKTASRTFYMPHRPVYKAESVTTRTRIVFDASARAQDNLSLNDNLFAGPNLLPDILSVLLNFRIGRIGLVADIEKAFLQISLAEQDRDALRFLWFHRKVDNLSELPSYSEFRMTRVPFGVTCSPFLLTSTLKKHIENESLSYPNTCRILQRSFYMDDLILSVDNNETAFEIYINACDILKRASMTLRKWNSNSEELLSRIQRDLTMSNIQKVLGIMWFCSTDEITVDLRQVTQSVPTENVTKRIILQFVARIYDPLGILGPFVVRLKILFQETWKSKLEWNEPLPLQLLTTWNSCIADMQVLNNVMLPRCVFTSSNRSNVQLHIFADASLSAYGVVAYMRSLNEDGNISVRYLISKNRVAPIKSSGDSELTLPKLELTAALIASRLLSFLEKNLDVTWDCAFLWSDSNIALHWINGDIRRWKPYVVHRVTEIRNLTEHATWKHCPGDQNPADLLTRGISAVKLVNASVWLHGPPWLSNRIEDWHWPQTNCRLNDTSTITCLMAADEECKEVNEAVVPPVDITKFSNYRKLLRVTAYVLRFIFYRRDSHTSLHILANELQKAELVWIRLVQRQFYNAEIKALQGGKSISSSSIYSLDPVLDENGLLRVKTRLQEASMGYDAEFPVIIPKNCYFSKLIVLDAHERVLHGGVNTTLVRIREKFWILRARQLVKSTLAKCRVCKRLKGKPAFQPFAPLPRSRLNASRPFETTGIDFAGPLYVKLSDGDTATCKVYILLFTCATVRAIHLELVPSLNNDSCILAIRRFISRRGTPKRFISDNAMTFKRASKDLKLLGDVVYSDQLQGFIGNHGIEWSFIAERAPWWGGFWERLVKSVKEILRVTVGRSTLTSEQLHTFLTEAECMVNSRPLSYISDDPLDLSPLTPAHFLLGYFSTPLQVDTSKMQANDLRSVWKTRLRSTHIFIKRWRTEYLQQLRSAHHSARPPSTNLNVGDVVLLHDSSLPRVLWKLARVEFTFPGRDGRIRACEVRLANGSKFRRAVQLLYPLELSNNIADSPGGGC